MRVVLRDADIKFILDLLRKEKKKHDIKMEYLEDEIERLEVWVKKWRWRLIHLSYYEFKPGLDYMKARLSYLKSQDQWKMWEKHRALKYLICRYESMLRHKVGRPLGATKYGYSFVKEVVKEKVSH